MVWRCSSFYAKFSTFTWTIFTTCLSCYYDLKGLDASIGFIAKSGESLKMLRTALLSHQITSVSSNIISYSHFRLSIHLLITMILRDLAPKRKPQIKIPGVNNMSMPILYDANFLETISTQRYEWNCARYRFPVDIWFIYGKNLDPWKIICQILYPFTLYKSDRKILPMFILPTLMSCTPTFMLFTTYPLPGALYQQLEILASTAAGDCRSIDELLRPLACSACLLSVCQI